MDDAKPKLEFFSDIKDKFFLILGGIVSLTTFIPAFLNKTAEIFGWQSIAWGYYCFVAIYFIFPFIFYLLYCGIHDYVGFLELLPDRILNRLNKRKWVMFLAEVIIACLAMIYLVCPVPGLNEWGSFCLIALSLGCFGRFFLNYVRVKSLKPLVMEFTIIGLVIILIFGLFFKNIFQNGHKDGLLSYSKTDQLKAFDAYDSKDALKKYYIDVLDSSRVSTYKYGMEAAVLAPAPSGGIEIKQSSLYPCLLDLYLHIRELEMKKDTPLSICFIKQNAAAFRQTATDLRKYEEASIAANNHNLNELNQISQSSFYLYDYALAVQKEKLAPITDKWTMVLKDLQYKSLVWFQLLILMSLCLWLKMQVKLKSIPNKAYKHVPLIIDNLSQIKSLIFLLFVLVIPWFRSIDAKSVALDRPFLNLSLTGLVNGEYLSGPSVSPEHSDGNEEFNLNFNALPVYASKHDSVLDIINANVKQSLKLTKAHALRTIGSAEDREYFDKMK